MKNRTRVSTNIALIGLACVFVAACGKEEQSAANDDQAAANDAMEPTSAVLPVTDSPDGARVFIISPANGSTVKNPIHVDFGIEGMSVVPAGDNQPHSGHHHLIIDSDLPDPSLPIPADANHIHFGDGSTSTEIVLEPGEHSLQMLLGDYLHIPHNPPVVSEPITITVE